MTLCTLLTCRRLSTLCVPPDEPHIPHPANLTDLAPPLTLCTPLCLSPSVCRQMSHIHIHAAERALLEAIALLLTSVICVPLVVSKIPGERWACLRAGACLSMGWGVSVGGHRAAAHLLCAPRGQQDPR
jgi:hypothetical protein